MSAVGLQRLASEESDTGMASTTFASHLRTELIRHETDHILSYYQSEHAGRTHVYSPTEDYVTAPSLMREASSGSVSSSQYSSDSLGRPLDGFTQNSAEPAKQPTVATAMGHTRRPSQPSEGGADRRRLAIVELDSTPPLSLAGEKGDRTLHSRYDSKRGTPMVSNGLLSRRGIHVDGLALVAPPDASPRTYTDLTPPTSAPIAADRAVTIAQGSSVSHQRSRSEAVRTAGKTPLRHQHSRDVGIVGSRVSSGGSAIMTSSEGYSAYAESGALKVPIFQTPTKSRSPSPVVRMANYSDSSTPGVQHSATHSILTPTAFGKTEAALTPAIGEYKDIQQPVVGPVVVGISSGIMRDDALDRAASPSSPDSQYSDSSPLSYYPRNSSSPYLLYEPGVHSTAGPLPAPPAPKLVIDERGGIASPPPPRPPRAAPRRDIAALKEALQLPKSVSAVLASRLTPEPEPISRPGLESRMNSASSNQGLDQKSQSSGSCSPQLSQPVHVREGAFPPSTLSVTHSQQLALVPSDSRPSTLPPKRNESLPPAKQSPRTEDDVQVGGDGTSSLSTDQSFLKLSPRAGLELRRESSWVSLGRQSSNREASPNGSVERVPGIAGAHSSTPSVQSPTPPPKSQDDRRAGSGGNPFRATLTNLKRFSALPRTPSFTSSIVKSSDSQPLRGPSPPVARQVLPQPRIRSAWPDAMQYHDVVSKKSALERSRGYAQKINELAMYDCGLMDWVAATKHRASHPRSAQVSATRLALTPETPTVRAFIAEPRHISYGSVKSHASVASEATFPARPDAYTATDLSMRPIDVASSPNTLPPALPYPSLASSSSRMSTLMPSPLRTLQLPLPSAKSGGISFFSSIGRKSSVKNGKDVPQTPSSPAKVLTKRSVFPSNPSRPVQITAAPSVPGGPRAAPGRIQRSQTYSVSPIQPALVSSEPSPMLEKRMSAATRRPSLFTRARAAPPPNSGSSLSSGSSGAVVPSPAMSSPEFEHQVDKLADLLPHADRDILAGYLRRAGQDILAIGQYLDDEKNGTLRRD